MWKDDNGTLKKSLVNIILHGQALSVFCCEKPEPHYCFYHHKDKKGSAWAWCSYCKSFVHLDFVPIPENWVGAEEIQLSDLSAVPIVLEEKRSLVDKQFQQCFGQ